MPSRKRQPFFVSETDPPARRRILEEALRLFAERGIEGTSIRDIGDAAGFTNPALYKHFAGKEELALHLFEVCYRNLAVQLAGAVSRDGDALPAFVRSWLGAVDEEPDAVTFVNENLHRFWPQLPEGTRPPSIVGLARELVRADRAGKGVPEELRVAALVGTLAQVTRMIRLGGLPGPAVKHEQGLIRLLEQALR